MNKKAELKDLLIAGTVSLFFMMGMIGLISIFINNDSSHMDTDDYNKFNSTFNTYDDIQTATSQLYDSSQSNSTQYDQQEGFFNTIFNKGFVTMSAIGSTFNFIKQMFLDIPKFFNIPDINWVFILIGVIITIILIFGIISLIFRWQV